MPHVLTLKRRWYSLRDSAMSQTLSSVLLAALALILTGCGQKKAGESVVAADGVGFRNSYNFGDVISFGRGGTSGAYKQLGWGETEKQFTWTNASSATLSFTIPPTEKPLRLRMRLGAFINRNDRYQHVDVIVNDERVAQWQIVGPDDFIAIIPPEVANRIQLMIELRIPRAVSPKAIGVGEDARMLGVCCYELEITEGADALEDAVRPETPKWTPYTYGRVIEFGRGEDAQPYMVSGWYPPEEQFTWTGKEPAVVELQVPRSYRPLRLKMRLSGMVWPGLPEQPTELYVNGKRFAMWMVGDAAADYEAIIPYGLVREDHRLAIELRPLKPISPKEVGKGGDSRVLGVRCDMLVVEEAFGEDARIKEAERPFDRRERDEPPGDPRREQP